MEERLSGDRHISVRARGGSPSSRWVRRGADKAEQTLGSSGFTPSRRGQVAAARPASASCEWEPGRASQGRPLPAASPGTARSSCRKAGRSVRQQQKSILAAKKMLLYRGAPAGPGAPGGGLARAGSVPQAFGIRLSTVGRWVPRGDGLARACAGPRAARGARGGPGGTRPQAGRDLLSPPDEPPLPPEQLQQSHATLQCHRGAAR